ncbi:hypothetical protein J2S49_001001 [Arcanobacterium wilhelmae]|uniref:Efflux transporter periplasmic adaptor subunit n=1 Tax=Arcanobacterium wilhelmae TaxID=1803177 RepID=A0ABT9NBQ9_9ACTO|nr:hypothetical protein [Arcanobacterium wilhelmae]
MKKVLSAVVLAAVGYGVFVKWLEVREREAAWVKVTDPE